MKKLVLAAALAAAGALADESVDGLVTGTIAAYDAGPSVFVIRGSAFADCRALEVVRAASAVEVGQMAFRGCVLLREVYLPAVTNGLPANAFAGCPRLEVVDLPLVTLDAARVSGFPWQTLSRAVVFRLADGSYDRNGKKLD